MSRVADRRMSARDPNVKLQDERQDSKVKSVEVKKKTKTLKNIRRKVLKTVWSMVCLAGLIIQIISISNQYFEYHINSKVYIGYQRRLVPPVLSICFTMAHLVNLDKAVRDGYCHRDFGSRKCYEVMDFGSNKRPSLDEETIYNKYTHDFVYRLGRSNKITPFYSGADEEAMKCVRVEYAPKGKSGALFEVKGLRKSRIFKIEIDSQKMITDQNLTEPIDIRYHVHSTNSFPHKSMSITGKTSTLTVITYRQYKTVRVSTPKFPCVFYEETRWQSKEHCVEECTIYEMYQRCLSDFTNATLAKILCRRSKFLKVVTSFHDYEPIACNKSLCPRECYINFYQPSIEQKDRPFGFVTQISLSHENPSTTIYFSLDLELLEYVIYVASLTGLWFGFVIHDSVKTICSLINVYYCNKKKSTRVVNCHKNIINNQHLTVQFHDFNQHIVETPNQSPPKRRRRQVKSGH